MHIAIIGAGAAGLASVRHAIDPTFNFTCEVFEQMDELGGTWIYTNQTGLDEYGIPVHTSMYKDLVTNLPKEVMNYPDFKFPDYEMSFINQEQVLKYLKDYTQHYNLQQYIKFRHFVNEVSPLPDNRWKVTVTDLRKNNSFATEFDAVLICNGHYSKPIIPNLPGKDIFKGKQMHSHDYRFSEMFQNQTVLVIGAGPSGIDVVYKVAEHASKVILSHRKNELPFIFHTNVIIKPATVGFLENKAQFKDETFESIDTIIYCTGYEYDFPFLTNDCGIKVVDNFIQPLYKHVVNIEKPTMGFIGIPFTVLPFPMFDYQVRMFLKHLKEQIKLPTKDEMKQDTKLNVELRKSKGYPTKHAHKLGADFQEPYFNELAKIAQEEPAPPVMFKIYGDASMRLQRQNIYRIIDNNTFVKTKYNNSRTVLQ